MPAPNPSRVPTSLTRNPIRNRSARNPCGNLRKSQIRTRTGKFRGKVQIYSRRRERWILCERREQHFVPSERFPKSGDPAQKNSSSNGLHQRADSRQKSASRCLPNFAPLQRTLLAHVPRPSRQRNATARLPLCDSATKMTAVGFRLPSCHKSDKHCRQVLSMIQSRIAKACWASNANSPPPYAEAMKCPNGSLPLGSRRSSGSLHPHLRGNLRRHLRGPHHHRVVQMRGLPWTQTELL